jgi:hypothetical protein
VKSSGSIWFVYGVAVVVTFGIGVLSFSVFVLSKVFGSDPSPTVQAQAPADPTPDQTKSHRVLRTTPARVLEVQAVKANPRQLVLIVATPSGCAQKLEAASYAEGPGAIAVRVTQQTYRSGCHLRAEPILVTASTSIADRTVIVNGTPWTSTSSGSYELALRTSS